MTKFFIPDEIPKDNDSYDSINNKLEKQIGKLRSLKQSVNTVENLYSSNKNVDEVINELDISIEEKTFLKYYWRRKTFSDEQIAG